MKLSTVHLGLCQAFSVLVSCRNVCELGALMLLALSVPSVQAFAPPKDEDSKLLRDYRQRIEEGSFGYRTKALNQMYCTYLSDEICEAHDNQTAVLTKMNMQSMRPKRSSFNGGEPNNDRELAGFPNDSFKIIVGLIQWDDHGSRNLIPRADIDALWNSQGVDAVLYPGGTIRDWVETSAYGGVSLEANVLDYFRSDFTESYIADGRSAVYNGNPNDPDFTDAIIPLLDDLDNSNFNFADYDSNNDKVIDSMVFLTSSYSAELGNSDCDGVAEADRIRSIMRSPGRSWESKDGYKIGPFAIASIYRQTCNENIARMGTMLHEFLHTVGLPDLYDLDGRPSTQAVGGIGGYDIMASPYGQVGRMAYPGDLSGWSKRQMGWMEPIEIFGDGVFTIRPTIEYPDYYMIAAPYEENEYLLIENRQALGIDQHMWGPGIAIYHIDENANVNTGEESYGNRNRGYPTQDGWPGNGNHFEVALLQADGDYELELGGNNGNAGDLWSAGQTLGPGNGESVAKDADYPNTDSYVEGNIRVTGLTITDFHEITDGSAVAGSWSFRVSGLGTGTQSPTPVDNDPTPSPTAPTPSPTVTPSPTATPSPTPVGGDAAPSMSVRWSSIVAGFVFLLGWVA